MVAQPTPTILALGDPTTYTSSTRMRVYSPLRPDATRPQKTGFSILEVLIAAFILGILTLAIIGLATVGTRTAFESERQTVAQGLVNQHLERVRALPYTSVGFTAPGLGEPDGVLLKSETRTQNNQPYTMTTAIALIDDPLNGTLPSVTEANADYKKVQVTSTWVVPGGTARMVTAATYVAAGVVPVPPSPSPSPSPTPPPECTPPPSPTPTPTPSCDPTKCPAGWECGSDGQCQPNSCDDVIPCSEELNCPTDHERISYCLADGNEYFRDWSCATGINEGFKQLCGIQGGYCQPTYYPQACTAPLCTAIGNACDVNQSTCCGGLYCETGTQPDQCACIPSGAQCDATKPCCGSTICQGNGKCSCLAEGAACDPQFVECCGGMTCLNGSCRQL